MVSVTDINLTPALMGRVRKYILFALYVLTRGRGSFTSERVNPPRVSQYDLSAVCMMINDVTTRHTRAVPSFSFSLSVFSPFLFFLSGVANQLVTLEWRYIS